MGCVSSKWATSPPPSPPPPPPLPLSRTSGATLPHHGSRSSRKASSGFHKRGAEFGELEKIKEEDNEEEEEEEYEEQNQEVEDLILRGSAAVVESGNATHAREQFNSSAKSENKASFLLRFGRYTQAEHIAAGWPSWLSAVAGEAIDGWLPLKADSFEKLDKIGQGTYSNVYRARSKESGRVFALKKVRFDTFQPDSVRFMAREIAILRKLDHPNIMKLEGLVTNRLSCSLYLVFEYMEHDLSGLLSCPDIKFSDAQIKCYMQQLLRGIEHCHSRGIMHRDIKTSNILVNNDGILKIADFGLANTISSRHRLELTSRVVTLWYRPPELLLGATTYGESVDLWSVGCVFAELFIGRPVLKGRTEVEQLHKIFKLCGSPHDDYWTNSNLPLATMFKPQQPYTSILRERCKELPKSAVNLLETFLSIEPLKRLTAASALDSEYFKTKPYASDPSLLPKYPPNKEIDAKAREDARRRKVVDVRLRSSGGTSKIPRRAHQDPSSNSRKPEGEKRVQFVHGYTTVRRSKGGATASRDSLKSYDTMSVVSQSTIVSQVDSIRSVPNGPSSGFHWTRLREEEVGEEQDPFCRKLQSYGGSKMHGLGAPNSLAALFGGEDLDDQEKEEPFNNTLKAKGNNHTETLPNWADYPFNASSSEANHVCREEKRKGSTIKIPANLRQGLRFTEV